ncbi:MAG: hypothetical protein ABWZ66_08310 [Pyrinomonadaceae bacterium]
MPVAVRTKRLVLKPANPQADPRFKSVKDKVGQKAAQLKKHPPAKQKATEAAKAAKGPPNEKAAGAKDKQVDALKDTKAEAPPPDSFLSVLRAEIEKVMPSNIEDAGNFMDGGAEGEMKGAVGGNVKDQKETASGDLQKNSAKPPDEGGVPTKPVEAIPPDPNVPVSPVNAAAGMPAPKPDAEISEKQTKADAQTAMKENRLDGKRLENKDSRFETVKSEKGNVDKVADASPNKYRAGENQTLGKAASQANVSARTGMTALTSVKNKSKSAVQSRQDAQKQKDEARRKAVTDRIEAIYNETKLKVDNNLNSLERDVMAIFDPGCSGAIASFKANTNREIDDFYDDRYSGVSGKLDWIADKFKDTPPRVKQIIQENLKSFTASMDALAVRVAGLVDQRLNKAKADIDGGQTKIKAFVASLPKDLKAVGQEAEKAMDSRFNEMRDGVESKKNDLAQKLAQKYKEAHDSANELAKKIEEENKGAFKKLADAIGEVIKIILEFKDKLMALLRKAADAIELILDDPIGFLGNLIAAVKAGVNQFVGNIWAHIKAGFMQWLFGALADAGIEIPADLSLISIFKLVMGVLGITYAKMRAKAVKILGPTAVTVIEKLIEYVSDLITGGPAKLWEHVKSDIGDLYAMVIDAIQSWLIDTVIKQASIKLLSFFNPAGAFVQALIAIYNTVMFIIENASKIMAFVEAVINSVSSIAQGAIGAAANWIEQSLARTIPLVIGFLARLIGLGGISKKVREFITKVQTKVDQAIDKALAKIVGVVKKLFGKLSGKPGKKERTEDEKKADVKKAADEAKSAAGTKQSWIKTKIKLSQIKKKYDLTSLKVKGQGAKISITANINPEATVSADAPKGEAKQNAAEAQNTAAEVKTVVQQSTSLIGTLPPVPGAKPPTPSDKHEQKRIAESAQRPNTITFPTKEEVHGIDAAHLRGTTAIPTASTDLSQVTLEIVEIKKGEKSLKVFDPKASSKGVNVENPLDIGTYPDIRGKTTAPAQFFKANPQEASKVAAGAVLLQTREKTDATGKVISSKKSKLDNKLSSMVTQLRSKIQKMYAAIDKCSLDPTVKDDVKKLIGDITSGKGGVLKFVIDIERGATMSDSEKALAVQLLKASFDLLMAGVENVKTTLSVVVRQVDEKGANVDEVLL